MSARCELPIGFIKAFNDSRYCDLTITCGSSTFHVYKLVICSRSVFFEKAVKFQVGREAEDNCIDLPEDDPEMIRRMIMFLYLANYDPISVAGLNPIMAIKLWRHEGEYAPSYHQRFAVFSSETSEGNAHCQCVGLRPDASDIQFQPTRRPPGVDKRPVKRPHDAIQVANPLTIHASMYALADKYDVEGLADHAKFKVKLCLHDHWDSEDFIPAVQIVYSSTPDTNRGLRDVIVKAFKTYFDVDIANIPGAEEKLATIDELSLLLMKSWSRRAD